MARLVVGVQPVREAIRAHGAAIERVLVEQGDHPQLAALARFARDQGIGVATVPRGELDRLAKGVRHQGAVALAPEIALVALEQVPTDEGALLVALDGLQDPQNFGAAIRSAVAFGASAVLWAEHASAPLTPATFRASAGAIEFARLCRVRSLPTALGELAARGVTSIGLDATATTALWDHDLTGPVVVVVGSEGQGLGRPVRRACTSLAKLPMRGPIASLNASVAAALAVYEVTRQRANLPSSP